MYIREFQKEDIWECADIYVDAFPKEYWGVEWNRETAAALLLDYFEEKHFVGYCAVNEKIEGFIVASSKQCGSGRELYINEMAVRTENQRKGIGSKLLDTARRYGAEHGMAGLVLYTNENAPAKGFYMKNCFLRSPGTICMYLVDEAGADDKDG